MHNVDEIRDDLAACQAGIDQAVAHFHNNIHLFTEEQTKMIRDHLRVSQDRLYIAQKYIDELKK